MQNNKKLILFALFLVGVACGCYVWRSKQSDNSLNIVGFNCDQDADAVDALIHKGDNMYWMIAGNPDYSVKFMLEYQTTSQQEKRHDLILKSAFFDDQLVGFLAYYPKSQHVWRLLFLIVDQNVRKQGFAKKLLNFAVQDMVKRGAFQISLFTRNNNLKAQALYKNYGFKLTSVDDIGVWLSWNKM